MKDNKIVKADDYVYVRKVDIVQSSTPDENKVKADDLNYFEDEIQELKEKKADKSEIPNTDDFVKKEDFESDEFRNDIVDRLSIKEEFVENVSINEKTHTGVSNKLIASVPFKDYITDKVINDEPFKNDVSNKISLKDDFRTSVKDKLAVDQPFILAVAKEVDIPPIDPENFNTQLINNEKFIQVSADLEQAKKDIIDLQKRVKALEDTGQLTQEQFNTMFKVSYETVDLDATKK